MNTSKQQNRRLNAIEFTGNVAKVTPVGEHLVVSLAFNEGSYQNDEWVQKDTLYMKAFLSVKIYNYQVSVGDKLTVRGFLASDNFKPEGGKKRYNVQITVMEVVEHLLKQHDSQPQSGYQSQPQSPQQQPQRYQSQQQPQHSGHRQPNQPSSQQQPQHSGHRQSNQPSPQQQPPQRYQPQSQPQPQYSADSNRFQSGWPN